MIILFGEARSPDIFYRCGWNSDVDVVYVEGKERILYVPGFEYLRAKREVQGTVRVERLEDPFTLMESFEGDVTIPTRFPYALAERIQGDVSTEREIFPQRRIKSEAEIDAITRAQDAARLAISAVGDTLADATIRDGCAVFEGAPLSSEGLKLRARTMLIQAGYDCPDMIISSGSQTGLPHHRGTGPITEGPVIVDIFPRSETTLYHGDMTRTFIVGEDEKSRRMLKAVKKAHDACIPLCVPGAKASHIHAQAEKLLLDAGFETTEESGFIHSLGHGVGLSVHEMPSLSPKDDTVLEAGMIVTVEPGLYYDMGVRWEDIVVVSEKPRTL